MTIRSRGKSLGSRNDDNERNKILNIEAVKKENDDDRLPLEMDNQSQVDSLSSPGLKNFMAFKKVQNRNSTTRPASSVTQMLSRQTMSFYNQSELDDPNRESKESKQERIRNWQRSISPKYLTKFSAKEQHHWCKQDSHHRSKYFNDKSRNPNAALGNNRSKVDQIMSKCERMTYNEKRFKK